MSTLLLRFAAPLQSWGAESKYDVRKTEREPTKSGIIGFISAALGRRRNESIDDLRELRVGVRVDKEGLLSKDFQTAHNDKSAYVTYRYYLSDAVFLIGLEGDDTLLDTIENAVREPYFPLFLGRRSCPPEGKIIIGLRKGIDLEQALKNEPSLVSTARRHGIGSAVRLCTDSAPDNKNTVIKRDDPVSFDQSERKYGFRRSREVFLSFSPPEQDTLIDTDHDPLIEL